MFPRVWALVIPLVGAAFSQSGADPGYRAYLWREEDRPISAEAAEALRRAGVTGTDGEGPRGVATARALGLPFYVDHAIPKGFLHVREADFLRASAAAQQGRDDAGRLRLPCLRNAAALAAAEADLRATLAALGDAAPDFLSLADEASVTRSVNPLDTCACPGCLADLPAFLARRWGGAGAAAAVWGARLPADGPPRPPTTSEARAAVFHEVGDPSTLAAWGDARAHADQAFVDAVTRLANVARGARPDLPVGILGSAMPSAFGGYDWAQLASQLDVAEVYDHGGARALAGALAAPGARFVATLTAESSDVEALRQKIWRRFLRGDRGSILFWSRDWCVDGDPARPSPVLEALGPTFLELAGPALKGWRAATPAPAAAALWFSMPSVRLNWLFDTRDDGDTWFRRLASYEVRHGTDARTREAWIALCDDLGIAVTFATSARLAADPELRRRLTTVILPRLCAVSDAEVREIRDLAQGRLVVADARAGLFTHRYEDRSVPAFDALFGLRRPRGGRAAYVRSPVAAPGAWPVVEPDLEAVDAFADRRQGRVPLILRGRRDEAETLYLNLDIGSYVEDRVLDPPRAERLRRAVYPYLLGSGRRPRYVVETAADLAGRPVALHVRTAGTDTYVAVEWNLATNDRDPPLAAYADRRPFALKLRLPVRQRIWDVRRGQDLGAATEIDLEIGLGDPRILRLSKP